MITTGIQSSLTMLGDCRPLIILLLSTMFDYRRSSKVFDNPRRLSKIIEGLQRCLTMSKSFEIDKDNRWSSKRPSRNVESASKAVKGVRRWFTTLQVLFESRPPHDLHYVTHHREDVLLRRCVVDGILPPHNVWSTTIEGVRC